MAQKILIDVKPGSGSVEYRRNLCTNPTFHGGDATSWSHYSEVGGSVAVTIGDDGGYSGAYYRRMTWLMSSPYGNRGGHYFTDAPGSHTPGQTYAFSAYIRPSSTRSFYCEVEWYDDALTPIAGAISATPSVQCQAGQWTRVSHVITAPAGGTRAQVRFFTLTGGAAAGETFDVDALLIEQADQVLPYFDGDLSPDPLLVPSWTDTTGASASVLTAQAPTGWAPSGGETAVLVTDDDGEPCVELIDPVGGGSGYLYALVNAADTPGVGRWVAFGVDVKPLTEDQASRMRLCVQTQNGSTTVDRQFSPTGAGWTAGQWTRQVVSVQQTGAADNIDAFVWPNGTPNRGPQFRARRAVVVFADTKEEAEALAATPLDVTQTRSVSLTATVDDEGDFSYEFSQVSGPSVSLSGTGNTRTFEEPEEWTEDIVIRVTATSNWGSIYKDVTVSPPFPTAQYIELVYDAAKEAWA